MLQTVTNSYKQLQTVTKIIAKTLYRRKGRCIIQIMGSANGSAKPNNCKELKMQKYQIMGDLIAGALAKKDLLKLVEILTKMGKTAADDGNCDFVADQLREGYYNWTGEQL